MVSDVNYGQIIDQVIACFTFTDCRSLSKQSYMRLCEYFGKYSLIYRAITYVIYTPVDLWLMPNFIWKFSPFWPTPYHFLSLQIWGKIAIHMMRLNGLLLCYQMEKSILQSLTIAQVWKSTFKSKTFCSKQRNGQIFEEISPPFTVWIRKLKRKSLCIYVEWKILHLAFNHS